MQKDPKKYSSFLFKKASSDYLNEFLKNYNKCYEIDIDEGIKRVCNDCTQLGIIAGARSVNPRKNTEHSGRKRTKKQYRCSNCKSYNHTAARCPFEKKAKKKRMKKNILFSSESK